MRLKEIFLLICLQTAYQTGFAQSDSLKRSNSYAHDTVLLMEYNTIARDLILKTRNYAAALDYLQKGVELADQIGYPKGKAELLRSEGLIHYNLKNYSRAISAFQQAMTLSETLNNADGIAENANNIAIIYIEQSKLYEAFNYLLSASEQWEKVHNSEGILRAYRNIIRIYQSVQNFAEAIAYIEKALRVAHDVGNKAEEASLYNILAQTNVDMGYSWEVESYYKKSIQLYDEIDDQLQVARVMQNMASNLYINDLPKRLNLLEKSSAIYEKLDPTNSTLYTIYNNMGEIYLTMEQTGKALMFKQKALAKANLSKNTVIMARANLAMGQFYLKRNLDEAGKFFNTAYEMSGSTGLRTVQSEALSGIIDVKYRKGDYIDAMKDLRKYRITVDSLTKVDREHNLAQIAMQYEFQQNERTKQQTDLQKHQEKDEQERMQHSIEQILIVVSIVLVILFLAIWYGNWLNRKTNRDLSQQQERMNAINKKLQSSNDELSIYKDRLEKRVKTQTEKLQKTEKQLRILSENLPGGCIYQKVITPDGREHITYISNTSSQLMGAPASAIINNINAFYSQINSDDLRKKKLLEQESYRTMTACSTELRVKSGDKEIWLLENSMPYRGESDNIIFNGIAVDITEQKNTEAALIQARQQAERSDILKTSFLANLSHEIRTPMNGIVGFLSVLEQAHNDAHKRQTSIQVIRSNVRQLLQLMGDIIDISKIDAQEIKIHPMPFDLNVLMNETELFFRSMVRQSNKKIEIFHDQSHEITPCVIHSDIVRLRQILTNLLTNATKFTHKGYIKFGYTLNDAHTLHFFVEDTGIGIPAVKQTEIFERFMQVGDTSVANQSGAGLGLAITRNLVGLLGGHIWVESTENIGSTFHFTLPYIQHS